MISISIHDDHGQPKPPEFFWVVEYSDNFSASVWLVSFGSGWAFISDLNRAARFPSHSRAVLVATEVGPPKGLTLATRWVQRAVADAVGKVSYR